MTPTERQVMEYVAQGLSNPEIAAVMGYKRVKYIENWMLKLYQYAGLTEERSNAKRVKLVLWWQENDRYTPGMARL